METSTDIVIKRIQDSYNRILQIYRGASIDMLLAPTLSNGWSVKDTLAHIAAWDARCAALLAEGHASNGPLKASPDVDALNHETFVECRALSWEGVEQEFREGHRALIEAIEALPPERLQDDVVQRSIAEETWEHYDQHLLELERWREQVTRAARAPTG